MPQSHHPRASFPRNKACPRRDCLDHGCCLHDPCVGNCGVGWTQVAGYTVGYQHDTSTMLVHCWSPDALDVRAEGETIAVAIDNMEHALINQWHKTRLNRIRGMLKTLCERQLKTSHPFINLSGEHNFRDEVLAALSELERHIYDELESTRKSPSPEMLLLPKKKGKEALRTKCARWLRKLADILQPRMSGKVRLREQMLE